jgi:type II secretory pathway component PulM
MFDGFENMTGKGNTLQTAFRKVSFHYLLSWWPKFRFQIRLRVKTICGTENRTGTSKQIVFTVLL